MDLLIMFERDRYKYRDLINILRCKNVINNPDISQETKAMIIDKSIKYITSSENKDIIIMFHEALYRLKISNTKKKTFPLAEYICYGKYKYRTRPGFSSGEWDEIPNSRYSKTCSKCMGGLLRHVSSNHNEHELIDYYKEDAYIIESDEICYDCYSTNS